MDTINIKEIRRDYKGEALNVDNIDKDPLKQFDDWMKSAIESEIIDPNAMIIATVNENGVPSSRTVLLREVSQHGIVFYTNYNSTKGQNLLTNSNVSCTFFWKEIDRQVHIVGKAHKVEKEVSQAYFKSRPFESQLSAVASPQSSKIESRTELENKVKELRTKFSESNPPSCPTNWGGYNIVPSVFEFWQGRPNRLHDRVIYKKTDNNWDVYQVAP